MKAVLLLVLISLITCQPGIVGGFEKRSITENNIYIDRCFNEAYKAYANSEDANPDDYLPLTVYSQVVAGTNYKVTFVDPKVQVATVQEYVVFVPLPHQVRNGANIQVTRHKEYQASKSLNLNDKSNTPIQQHLIKGLEDTEEKIKEITSISKIENRHSYFYVIDAQTENGNHQYIVVQDRFTNEFEFPQKIR